MCLKLILVQNKHCIISIFSTLEFLDLKKEWTEIGEGNSMTWDKRQNNRTPLWYCRMPQAFH